MSLFKEQNEFGIIKLFSTVNKQEVTKISIIDCVDLCVEFFLKNLNKTPNDFSINFRAVKTTKLSEFLQELKFIKNDDFVELNLWEQSTKSFISITNEIPESSLESKGFISVVLVLKKINLDYESLKIFLIELYDFLKIEYGYYLELPKGYDFLNERKYKRSFFGRKIVQNTRQDISLYRKMYKVHEGYFNKIYPFNVLNNNHVKSEEIKECAQKTDYMLENLNSKLHILYKTK